jgi:uncharacterized protein YggU (UPF0235/DUF167 family)
VRVSAAAADGAANAALTAFLAKALGRPKGAVAVISGETARMKMIEAQGADADDVARAFGAPPG